MTGQNHVKAYPRMNSFAAKKVHFDNSVVESKF